MTTKERIMEEALNLFSLKGFHAVSVRDIVKKVGIKESSMYNHFKSKQDLFDTIVDHCFSKAETYFQERNLPFGIEDDKTLFHERDFTKLSESVLSVFRYFFEDSYNIRFRNLLIISQFENGKAKQAYRKLFRDYPLQFQTNLFQTLIDSHYFLPGDPAVMATNFYGTIFMLIHTYDSFDEAKPLILKHLKHFWECHLDTREI